MSMRSNDSDLVQIIASLGERIAGDEIITIENVPSALREHPAVLWLLKIGRVGRVLLQNQHCFADDALPVRELIGPWRVINHLGRGGLGDA